MVYDNDQSFHSQVEVDENEKSAQDRAIDDWISPVASSSKWWFSTFHNITDMVDLIKFLFLVFLFFFFFKCVAGKNGDFSCFVLVI